MTHYEFEPGSKRGRNKYVGSWTETPAPPIDLPYTKANLAHLLAIGGNASQAFAHQQIARWCDLYVFHFYDDPNSGDATSAYDIASDVSAQWNMYLANTYTLPQLQSLDFTAIKLPLEWFADWESQLSAAGG